MRLTCAWGKGDINVGEMGGGVGQVTKHTKRMH